MELELIYSKISYENARHMMEQKHIECIRVEEELKHFRTLLELNEQKISLLKSRSIRQYTYLPKK